MSSPSLAVGRGNAPGWARGVWSLPIGARGQARRELRVVSSWARPRWCRASAWRGFCPVGRSSTASIAGASVSSAASCGLPKLFARTLREDPADAEVASPPPAAAGRVLPQGGAGIYTTMPLGLRVMRKIEAIVREEMDAVGRPGDPHAHHAARRALEGDGPLGRLRGRDVPAHRTGTTASSCSAPRRRRWSRRWSQAEFPSYRDLPVNLYQIEWKYRDELRPRYGLLRVREFLMKDAYTFDRDEDGMRASYQVMFDAYRRVFDRCSPRVRDRRGRPGDDRRRRQPRVHGARRRRRGPLRAMRERGLSRRHRGRDAASARPGRCQRSRAR